jgi:hypothetical protein
VKAPFSHLHHLNGYHLREVPDQQRPLYRGHLIKQQAGLVDHEQMESWLEFAAQSPVIRM